MRILWLDAFHAGSHRAVALGYASHSTAQVTVLGLPHDGGWRWRMRGAAISMARMVRERWSGHLRQHFDVVVATDMLDVATFLALTRDIMSNIPIAIYMHENQLTYPLPAGRKLDLTWPWLNYTGMLAADAVLFNSDFHRQALLAALPGLPRRFHDYHELDAVASIAPKTHVLYPGIDLRRFDGATLPRPSGAPVVLWNSRWDYDKQPLHFFTSMAQMMHEGIPLQLIVVGEYVDPGNDDFARMREVLAPITRHWGYVPDAAHYRDLLHQADVVVSAAIQEFFGIAVIEATYTGAVPLLPKRLAYPELLPAAYHDLLLYDGDSHLVPALTQLLTQLATLDRQPLQRWAAQFDWAQMAPQYDALFARIAGRL